jgi:hypothetical protein
MNVNEFIVYHQGLTQSGEVGEVFDLSMLESPFCVSKAKKMSPC